MANPIWNDPPLPKPRLTVKDKYGRELVVGRDDLAIKREGVENLCNLDFDRKHGPHPPAVFAVYNGKSVLSIIVAQDMLDAIEKLGQQWGSVSVIWLPDGPDRQAKQVGFRNMSGNCSQLHLVRVPKQSVIGKVVEAETREYE